MENEKRGKLLEKRLREIKEDVTLAIYDLCKVYEKFRGEKHEKSS